MTWFEFFAFVGMPAILFVIAFVGVKWTLWDVDRRDRLHPGE